MYDGQIQYFIKQGPFIGFLGYSKVTDNSLSAVSSGTINATRTDRDYDSYRIAGIYEFKGGEVGALFLYDRDATHRGSAGLFDSPPTGPYLSNIFVIDPYVKAKIGPVTLQAEALYYFGDALKWEGSAFGAPFNNALVGGDVSINALSVFVDATVTLNPVYFGGTFAYLSGDKPDANNPNGTGGTLEGGPKVNVGGADWNPCLMMFNTETMGYWVGPIYGHTNSVLDNQMSNAYFFQGRVGVKPIPQLDILMSASYAMADQKPTNPTNPFTGRTYANGTYGTEVDITGTYKITNNLSYMLGFGYLFTGDYFKGFDRAGEDYKTQDDFIVINKLVLSF
jgi:hypothetical protein